MLAAEIGAHVGLHQVQIQLGVKDKVEPETKIKIGENIHKGSFRMLGLKISFDRRAQNVA